MPMMVSYEPTGQMEFVLHRSLWRVVPILLFTFASLAMQNHLLG